METFVGCMYAGEDCAVVRGGEWHVHLLVMIVVVVDFLSVLQLLLVLFLDFLIIHQA